MQTFLEEFRQTIESSAERLLELSASESQTPRAQDKWSPREIVGHLIDSAANNHQRFVRAQFTDDLVFSGYQQEEWVSLQKYHQENWDHLVQLWKHYNLHLLHVMQNTPSEQLTKLRTKHNLHELAWQPVAVDQPTTLEYFMRDYVGHLKHHLRQILGGDWLPQR
jgi:hypothetical protein